MSVPAFLKSGPAVTSFGIFGTGAVGVGGGQVVEFVEYENSGPLAMQINFPSGKSPSSKLGVTATTETVGAFSEKYDCFNGFFAGATFSHDWGLTENSGQQVKSINPSDVTGDVNPPSFQGKKDLKGCALMQLAQRVNKDDPYGSLKAEIAVKNEKIGGSLWIFGNGYVEKNSHGSKTQYSQYLYYRLALLEWEGGKGNVRMGYFWDDVNGLHVFNIKVIVPGNETWINKRATTPDNSEPTFSDFSKYNLGPELKEFSGEWVASEDGKEIFEDMSASSTTDSTYKKGILGNAGGFSDSEISVSSVYHPKQDKWVYFDKESNGQTKRFDPKDVLDKWYSPFKGKKGKGTKLN